MEPHDLSNGSNTLNDVMYRRLKNRERQRRYREKKRLLQRKRSSDSDRNDASNVHVTNHSSSQMQIVSLPTNGTVEQVVTRIHCRRDWKKDARRAHAAKLEGISIGLPSSGQCLASENHMPHVPSGTQEAKQILKSEVASESYPRQYDSEKVRSKPGRRDWKAEARNKK